MAKYKFSDRLMFAIIMHDESLCRQFIERVFPGRKVAKINLLSSEKTIITGLKSKSVRLDVMFEGDNKVYDIEMQVARENALYKRARYYQSAMAIHSLKSGEDYDKLKETYVIFICQFDPMRKGESIYRLSTYEENLGLKIPDGCNTILLNTKCPLEKVPQELRPLFEYIESGKAESDGFVLQIDEKVREAEFSEEVKRIMTVEQELKIQYRIGRENGMEEGEEKKAREIAGEMLKEGMKPDLITRLTGLSIAEIEAL